LPDLDVQEQTPQEVLMRLRHLLAALAVSVAWGATAEAAPTATTVNLDKVETAYAHYRRPHRRKVVYRNWGPRRSARVVRYAPPYRYARPYRYGYYGPGYPYYRPAYGYYRPARYYGGYGYGRPYYGYGRPYGGVSIGVGF
jgi:hypothetical protein